MDGLETNNINTSRYVVESDVNGRERSQKDRALVSFRALTFEVILAFAGAKSLPLFGRRTDVT